MACSIDSSERSVFFKIVVGVPKKAKQPGSCEPRNDRAPTGVWPECGKTHSTFGLVPCDAIQLSRSDFIAGLRADRLAAPGCLDQAMTGESFKEYLRSQLGSTLKPGDSVICDNLPAHKVAEVQAIIEAHGATIKYRPPYSPDLNPIEQVFAKL
ncbi:transposase, partial [Methylobacter sp.]|uniref:transposase n=1 Tax=Methylobacter sp. TaxID=2051955 RepID=UPI003DA531B1